jgi:hypothetical protein
MTEYGDYYDNMGYSSYHFNAFQKERLGWLNFGVSPPLTTVSSSGTYAISPLETAGSTSKALKIARGTTGTYFYVELRRGLGFDAGMAGNGNISNGVVIHLASPSDANSSDLLDMTATDTFDDPALTAGQTYTDPASGVSITVNSISASVASVTVTLGGTPPPTPTPTPRVTAPPTAPPTPPPTATPTPSPDAHPRLRARIVNPLVTLVSAQTVSCGRHARLVQPDGDQQGRQPLHDVHLHADLRHSCRLDGHVDIHLASAADRRDRYDNSECHLGRDRHQWHVCHQRHRQKHHRPDGLRFPLLQLHRQQPGRRRRQHGAPSPTISAGRLGAPGRAWTPVASNFVVASGMLKTQLGSTRNQPVHRDGPLRTDGARGSRLHLRRQATWDRSSDSSCATGIAALLPGPSRDRRNEPPLHLKIVNGVQTDLANASLANPAKNVAFHITARVTGTTLSLDFGGVNKVNVNDSTFSTGKVGIRMFNNTTTAQQQADNFRATVQ